SLATFTCRSRLHRHAATAARRRTEQGLDLLAGPDADAPQTLAPTPPGSEPQPPQLLRVPLPVLGDLHIQVQEDRGTEQGLDLLAGPDADVLEALALGADDDALLAGALDEQVGVDVEQGLVGGAVLAGQHLLDDDRDGVREFVPDALQGRLTDQFR